MLIQQPNILGVSVDAKSNQIMKVEKPKNSLKLMVTITSLREYP